MPHCVACHAHFRGSGSYCAIHDPYSHDYDHHYSSDYRDTIPIKYRTGHFRANPHHRRKHRPLGFQDSFDSLDSFNPRNAMTRYNHQNQVVHGGAYDGVHDEWAHDNPVAHSSVVRPLTTTFNQLADTHAIAALTYSVSPAGGHSVMATANLEREQCNVCAKYFPDRQRLDAHTWEFPVGCERHRVCLREEDVAWHAQSERHERCFVRGCQAVYRREGGWKTAVVREHVRGWHG